MKARAVSDRGSAGMVRNVVRLRAVVLGVLLAALVLFAPAAARAAQTYNDTVSGHEYFATSTDGKFAGTASGALPGAWNADVQHTPLCVSCTPTATITGGTFELATAVDSVPTLVTGRFTGGTVQVLNPGANCTNQTFAVHGILGDVGPWSTGSGSGTFDVTLTHYRFPLFGSCITYGASVRGTLSLAF
jgi:hypothetical protein